MKPTTLILLSVFVFAFALVIQAQTHLIDFTAPIMGLDGKPIANGDAKSPESTTLSDIAVTALENNLDEDKTTTGEQKFKRDELARKVYKNKKASLTVEEIATIKERIGKMYSALVIGAAWRLLDPAAASAIK